MLSTRPAARRLLTGAASAVAVLAMTVGATAPASAGRSNYKAPYPAGESYVVTQGPEGRWSHVGAYNDHAYDIALPANYEVSAAEAGTVIVSGWSPYWQNGIEVLIRHSNGQCTHYAHLNRALYRVGSHVPQGRVIGWSGATGAANGPHLHFQAINCYSRVGVPATVEGWTPRTGAWPRSSNYRR